MADEKLNTGQEENPQPSLFDAGPEGRRLLTQVSVSHRVMS